MHSFRERASHQRHPCVPRISLSHHFGLTTGWNFNHHDLLYVVSLNPSNVADDRNLIKHTTAHASVEDESIRLQIRVLLVGQRHGCGFCHFLLILIKQLLVDLNLGWGESRSRNEIKLRVADQFSS